MFVSVDTWLIERVFERFARWWQKTISYTQDCFWWAFILYICATVWMFFVSIISYLSGPKPGTDEAVPWLFTILLVFLTPYAYFLIKKGKEITYNALSVRTSNPLKIISHGQSFRIIYGNLVLLSFARAFVDLFSQRFPQNILLFLVASAICSLVATIYFSACDPLSPSNEKSRLQKLFPADLQFREKKRYFWPLLTASSIVPTM